MTKTRSLKALFAPRPVAPTVGAQLRRSAVRSTIIFAGFALAYVAGLALTGSTHGVGDLDYATPESPEAAQVVEAHERDVDRAARLVERHDCWTGEAPADVTWPGGVVLSRVDERPRFYSADAVVDGALDHLFTSPDPEVVAVWGFCR